MAKTLEENGLSKEDLAKVNTLVKEKSVTLMYALASTRKLSEQRLLSIMAEHYQVPKVDLLKKSLNPAVINLIPASLAEAARIVAVDRVGNNLIVATSNPKNLTLLDKIKFTTGYFARFVLASESSISTILQKHYSAKSVAVSDKKQDEDSKDTTEKSRIAIKTRGVTYDSEVIELADKIIITCFQNEGSDIHVEPATSYVRIRIRIDGVLKEIVRANKQMRIPLVARLKVMCGLDIAERRLPQDGRLAISIDSVPIDFRVSTMPTVHGEKVVMRLLDQSSLKVDMTDLGFEQKELDIFTEVIRRPYGMVLVTGPTGSGKTTTLYSALASRNNVAENILTAEDPVEYNIDGINQVETKNKIGMSFAKILKTFLRQDPDVIMVGEIRDTETASIAINAALTGHLVLSTLHTNSSYETITRLINMGVEPYNIVGSLLCIIAQRLMRRLCPECKVVDDQANPDYLIKLGINKDFAHKLKVYKEQGCEKCEWMGSKGRIAIHEVLPMTPQLYDAIIDKATDAELKQVGINSGMHTLRQSALIKMAQGIVSVTEVLKVTSL